MIGVAIYDILKNDSDVAALVGTKIYPIQASESATVPYITYQVISNVPASSKDSVSLSDRYRVQVSCFETRNDKALLLAKKVRDVLDKHALATYTSITHTVKVSSIDFDGEIELKLDNADVFEIAQDYEIAAYINKRTFIDWFLPSKDELFEMYTNLYLEGVGGFVADGWYVTSSEYNAINIYRLLPSTGQNDYAGKNDYYHVRACRSFTAPVDTYSLRDIGPAGGLICYITGTTFYESAPSDQSTSQVWSNIDNVEIGASAQGTAIGTGQANTTAIIAQDGHTDSAAKLCDDLSI